MAKIANNKAKSPTRLTNIALIADLLAWILVNQKLINRYDDTPTPSQPTNICKKLFAVTKISIKKVNNDKYDINLGKWGSCSIYSVEYKWTKKDINVTITSIIAVKLSKQKDQCNSNESTQIHSKIFII